VLNAAPVVYMGKVSYSFYLWQQVFLDRSHHAWYTAFPVNIVLAGLAAAASYHLVEQPFLRLKDRLAPPRGVAPP
jgi:peptidoglycan/LPS O-acetylase OafA/YrhL